MTPASIRMFSPASLEEARQVVARFVEHYAGDAIHVVGTTGSSGAATFSIGEPDALVIDSTSSTWIAEYDLDGGLLGVQTLAYHGADTLHFRPLPHGWLVAGEFQNTMRFAPDTPTEASLTSAGSTDLFAAYFLHDGSLDWVIQVSAERRLELRALAPTTELGAAMVVAHPEDLIVGPATASPITVPDQGGYDITLVGLSAAPH